MKNGLKNFLLKKLDVLMINYTQRKVILYNLPINEKTVLLNPEEAIIKYGEHGTLDIGSYCYLDRSNNKNRLQHEGRTVNIKSLNKERVKHVRRLIQIISDDFSFSSFSKETIFNQSRHFLSFIKWADSSGHLNFFDDKNKAKEAFSFFVYYLKDKLSKNELVSASAIALQYNSLKFLEKFHNTEDLAIGIPIIRANGVTNYTSPPSEDSQNKTLLLCESLFEGISDLILNNKPFPYQLKVPKHIGWKNNTFYLFPLNTWAVNPQNYNEKQGGIWNQNEGRLNSKEEIKHLYKTDDNIRCTINRAKKMLHNANTNQYSTYRLRLAMVAHHAFSIVFLATTGINREAVLNLLWNDNYEASPERQGFRTIKHRAGNKICHFELSIKMMPKFKKFLELRKYLLNNRNCEYLFFSLGANSSQDPIKLTGKSFCRFFDTLQSIDPTIEKITPREWRAAKSDWLVKNTDVSTAALMLQNSEQVLLKHYTAGSETEHLSELSNFFSEVSNFVLEKNDKSDGESSSVGICSNYGNPNPLDNAPVKVNCKSPEGCLFCDKYRIHADEKDTRKLVSCRYCLQKTAQLSNNKEDFDAVFGKIFQRIDELLKEIEEIKPCLTTKIIEEVEVMGELDHYWARKLELLFDLGLVS
jgi:integrase